MNDQDLLFAAIEKNNGFITSTQVAEAGLPRRVLGELVVAEKIIRVARGIYALPNIWEDEMYFLQYRYTKGVFSNETALYLHGLTDRTPQAYTLTFPHNYNAPSIKNHNLKVKFVTAEIYDLGIVKIQSSVGNPICAYNKESRKRQRKNAYPHSLSCKTI